MPQFGKLWRWVFESREFSSTEKLVFSTLCLYQNAEKSCYPSIQAIASMASLGKSSVKKSLSSLETLGAIKRVNRYNEGGKTSNIYHLADEPPRDLTEISRAAKQPRVSHDTTEHRSPRDHEIDQEHIKEQRGDESSLFIISDATESNDGKSPGIDFEEFSRNLLSELKGEMNG